jgi:hypothetical protein
MTHDEVDQLLQHYLREHPDAAISYYHFAGDDEPTPVGKIDDLEHLMRWGADRGYLDHGEVNEILAALREQLEE